MNNLIGSSTEDLLGVSPEDCARWLHTAATPAEGCPVTSQVVLGNKKFTWDELPAEHRELLTEAMGVVLGVVGGKLRHDAHQRLVAGTVDEGESTPYTPDPSQDAPRKWWRR